MPSRLQRWLDEGIPEGCLLILSGSSMRMMNDLFLHRAAPLYGRAQKLLQVGPMDYRPFCQACHLDRTAETSFEKFSCVGGIPKYWEFVEAGKSVLDLVETLFFDLAPYMEQEPRRTLYRIQDPAIRFWFGVFSPHRSLWPSYPPEKKQLLGHGHAAAVFEDWCRSRHPGSSRYWDKTVGIDLVAPDPEDPARLLVGEVKWKRLTSAERKGVQRDLEQKWLPYPLSERHRAPRFAVLDAREIATA